MPLTRQHALQACTFGRSVTSPRRPATVLVYWDAFIVVVVPAVPWSLPAATPAVVPVVSPVVISAAKWRRGRDSNPRMGNEPITRFRVVRDQPGSATSPRVYQALLYAVVELLLRCRKLAPPARFERATNNLGGCCSIHLSYGGTSWTVARRQWTVVSGQWTVLSPTPSTLTVADRNCPSNNRGRGTIAPTILNVAGR